MRGASGILFGLAGALALVAGPVAAQESCADRLAAIAAALGEADLPEEQRANVETILGGARDMAAAGEEESCMRSADALDELWSSLALTGEVGDGPPEAAAPRPETAPNPSAPAPGEADPDAPPGGAAAPELTASEAQELVGRQVVDREGNPVGELVDVARLRGREQTFAVLRHGGLLGFGERDTMVMLGELERGETGAMVLSRTAAGVLDELPTYDRATFESLTGRLD